MRGFWALPAVLRVAIASKHVFSLNDDVLAFPQYDVSLLSDYVTESKAQSLLSAPVNPEASPDDGYTLALQAQDDASSFPWPPLRSQDAERYTYERLLKDSAPYLCRIPQPTPPSNDAVNATALKEEEDRELARANNHGWVLLSRMQGDCVYYWAGWWTYRYCFGDGVRQFHQLPVRPGAAAQAPAEDPAVPGFVLGSIEGTREWGAEEMEGGGGFKVGPAAVEARGTLQRKGETKYLVQKLEGGTECDLTGRKRQIEVQFHCSPSATDHISVIKELAICKYLMVINTPKLCDDVAFLPATHDAPHHISCSPILLPDAASPASPPPLLPSSDSDSDPDPAAAAPTMVGPIAVGAHALIPHGAKIEKSSMLGGPAGHARDEKVLGVVADSDGGRMAEDELRRLGVKNGRRHVELLVKTVEKKAGKGVRWRLELVDGPAGRGFRGIIGDEEEGKGERDVGGREAGQGGEQAEAGSGEDAAGEEAGEAAGEDPGAGGGEAAQGGGGDDDMKEMVRELVDRLVAEQAQRDAEERGGGGEGGEQLDRRAQEAVRELFEGQDGDEFVIFFDDGADEGEAWDDLWRDEL